MKTMKVWAKVFDLVQCTHCKKWKKKEEFGHSIYYARVCIECQRKYNLCPDCGGPVVVHTEPFACTGWHTVKEKKISNKVILWDLKERRKNRNLKRK